MDVAVRFHRHLALYLSNPESSDLLQTQLWLSDQAWLATPYGDFELFSEEFSSSETILFSPPGKPHTGVANENQPIANLAPQLWSPIMERLCAWPTLQSSTFSQGMDLMYSDDLECPGNAIFSIEPTLIPSASDTQNLETTLNEVFLTPEEVSREFETQSIEIKPAPGVSSMIRETVLSIAIIALPPLPLNSETAGEGLGSIVLGPSPNTPASGSPQQVNELEIITESPALPEICSTLRCSEVNSSLKTVLASGVPPKTSDNQISETYSVDKDRRPGVMHSEGLQQPTEREADRQLSLTYNQSHFNPHSTVERPKSSERVEMLDLTDSLPGVFTPANNFAQSTKPCPVGAHQDLPSPFQALSHIAMSNRKSVDDDTPLGESNLLVSHDDASQANPQESGSHDHRGAMSDDPTPVDDKEPLCPLKLEARPRWHGSQSRKRSNINLNQGMWYWKLSTLTKAYERDPEERDSPESPSRKRKKIQTFTQPAGLSEGSTRPIRRQPRRREDYIDYSKDKAIAQEIFEDDPGLDDLLDQALKNFTSAAQSQAVDTEKRRESNKNEPDKRFRQQWEEIMESLSTISEKQKSFQKALDQWSKKVIKPRDVKRAVNQAAYWDKRES